MPQPLLQSFDPTSMLLLSMDNTPPPPLVGRETSGGVLRPVLVWFDPLVMLLEGMGLPAYPAVDLDIAPRGRLVVRGSAALGGETLQARALGGADLWLGSDESYQVFLLDMGPVVEDAATIPELSVVPAVREYQPSGRFLTVTARLVVGLSVVGSSVYLALGNGRQTPGTIYRVSLHVGTQGDLTSGATRVDFPDIICPE